MWHWNVFHFQYFDFALSEAFQLTRIFFSVFLLLLSEVKVGQM